MNPRFLLAKYVADLNRMEPKNIGVIVWSSGDIFAQFLPTAEVDFVNDVTTYRRWIDFWSKRIQESEIRPNRGKSVAKSDPSCMDALQTTEKGNYLLVDAGEVLSRVPKSKGKDLLNQLYTELVATPDRRDKNSTSRTLRRRCDTLIESLDVQYKHRHPVECEWMGVKRSLRPDYWIGNGTPQAILQTVVVNKEQSVNHSAFVLERILETQIVPDSKCRVLFQSCDITSSLAEDSVRQFERLCGMIDVDNNYASYQLSDLVV